MMIPKVAGTTTEQTPSAQEAKLRKSAHQLEGVFVEQLFKAMRETVPDQGGMVERGSGEQMFAGMMDAHLASEAPERWHSGLGEALYRQLRAALPDEKQQASSLTKQQAPTPPMEKTR